MGSNGATDGSTDGAITFTADNNGDPGVVTSESFSYTDARGNWQSLNVSLSTASPNRSMWLTIRCDGASQTITIDGASATVSPAGAGHYASRPRDHRRGQ